MKLESKYSVEVPKVTIKILSQFLDDVLDMNVSEDAEIDIGFGLEPGTRKIVVTETE